MTVAHFEFRLQLESTRLRSLLRNPVECREVLLSPTRLDFFSTLLRHAIDEQRVPFTELLRHYAKNGVLWDEEDDEKTALR